MWSAITEDDVLTVLAGAELEACREQALAAGHGDPVPPTIAEITEEVRGYAAAGPGSPAGPLGTIPGRLLSAALDLLAVRLLNRLGRNPGVGRQAAALRAEARLRDAAAGRFLIDAPSGLPPEVESGPSPSFEGRPRRALARCARCAEDFR